MILRYWNEKNLMMCLAVYMYMHVLLSLSLSPSLCLHLFVSAYLSPSLCLCFSVSVSLSLSLSLYLFLSLSLYLSLFLSLSLYVLPPFLQVGLESVQPSSKREGFATVPDVTWEDVGALEDIRAELSLAILVSMIIILSMYENDCNMVLT